MGIYQIIFPNRANYRFYDFVKNLSFMYGLKREYYKNIQKMDRYVNIAIKDTTVVFRCPYIDDSQKSQVYIRGM